MPVVSKALEVWEQDLSARAKNTRKLYRRYLNQFLERWETTPDELYSMRKADFDSDDPRDKQSVERMVKVMMSEMRAEGYAASTCSFIGKAVSSFFESQGLPLELKSKDAPKVFYNGQYLALKEHIAKMWDYAPTENKIKTRAILTFVKDSGLRISDVSALNLCNYLEAKRVDQNGEMFAVFNPIETEKTSAPAFIHVGPETTAALDAYLEERETQGLPMDPDSPLFLNRYKTRYNSTSMGMIFLRLKKLLGLTKVSAHSLRKFHTTMLESAGVHENWIKKLEGKRVTGSMGPYSKPEETGKLTEAYVQAYPKLRIFGEQASATQVKEQADKIAELEKLLLDERRKNRKIDANLTKMQDELLTRIEAMEQRQREHFDKDQ